MIYFVVFGIRCCLGAVLLYLLGCCCIFCLTIAVVWIRCWLRLRFVSYLLANLFVNVVGWCFVFILVVCCWRRRFWGWYKTQNCVFCMVCECSCFCGFMWFSGLIVGGDFAINLAYFVRFALKWRILRVLG